MKPVHYKHREDNAETINIQGGIKLKVLVSGKDTDGTIAVLVDTVQPGGGPPIHIHNNQDETFLCVSGEFKIRVGDGVIEVKAGDVAFVPRGTIHGFRNVGTTEGVLQYAFTPALTIEEMFLEYAQAAKDNVESPEALAAIAERHGTTVVGPPLEG